jgi:hypothetical protein
MKVQMRIAVTHRMRARIAYEIVSQLAHMNLSEGSEITVSFGTGNSRLGGLEAPNLLDSREFDLAFANPSSITYMALKGLQPYCHPIEIRNLAVFPSWDRIGFAVSSGLRVTSLGEIWRRKIPLKLSTRDQGREGTTVFAIREVLNCYGWSIEELAAIGGNVDAVSMPWHSRRLEGLQHKRYDAVFDEGLDSWAELALAQGMSFLPLEDHVFNDMERLGFRRSMIPKNKFKGLTRDVPALEFGGWALYCRADFPEELAYWIVKAIDEKRDVIPVDGDRLEMSRICRDTEEGPLCIPLHPGAEKYYKEAGYLI